MDPQTVAIGFMIAKEIIQTYNLQSQISEENLAKLIAINLNRIDGIIETIKQEMGET